VPGSSAVAAATGAAATDAAACAVFSVVMAALSCGPGSGVLMILPPGIRMRMDVRRHPPGLPCRWRDGEPTG
jgi:hypothetical protein